MEKKDCSDLLFSVDTKCDDLLGIENGERNVIVPKTFLWTFIGLYI